MRSHQRGDLCPSCDRFIGPADHCPYCGEASAKSPFIRYLRLGALALAFVGLLLLFVMVTHRDLPVVKIGDITALMNFAYVRVVGTVERKPQIRERNGQVDYLSFAVSDGTGWLRIQAYGTTARAIVEQGLIPSRGVLVDVAGSLNVAAEGSPKLRIGSPTQLAMLTVDPRRSGVDP